MKFLNDSKLISQRQKQSKLEELNELYDEVSVELNKMKIYKQETVDPKKYYKLWRKRNELRERINDLEVSINLYN